MQGTSGVTVSPLTVAPSQLAGVGWIARPTFAPASWSPSSELKMNWVLLGRDAVCGQALEERLEGLVVVLRLGYVARATATQALRACSTVHLYPTKPGCSRCRGCRRCSRR